MSEFADKISELPKDNIETNPEHKQMVDMFLGVSQKVGFAMWKIMILLVVVVLCVAPIPYFKGYNKNYVFAAKILLVIVVFTILFYLV